MGKRALPDSRVDAGSGQTRPAPAADDGSGNGNGARGSWLVACFCAEWCGACRAFRADFEAARATFPAARFAWVDVEDHPDVLGDDDIDTFPTLLIADAAGRGFLGPVEPRPTMLHTLVTGALRGDYARQLPSAELAGVAERVTALPPGQGLRP